MPKEARDNRQNCRCRLLRLSQCGNVVLTMPALVLRISSLAMLIPDIEMIRTPSPGRRPRSDVQPALLSQFIAQVISLCSFIELTAADCSFDILIVWCGLGTATEKESVQPVAPDASCCIDMTSSGRCIYPTRSSKWQTARCAASMAKVSGGRAQRNQHRAQLMAQRGQRSMWHASNVLRALAMGGGECLAALLQTLLGFESRGRETVAGASSPARS